MLCVKYIALPIGSQTVVNMGWLVVGLMGMNKLLRSFAFSLTSTILVIAVSLYYLGAVALFPLLILIVIEITFSFDNAIVNAKVLKKMSPRWQQLFLTVGIVVAIFGMRLVFPILIVALTADLSWRSVIDLALNHPEAYAHELEVAHPTITAFGGAFLLMLSLHFFMAENKEHHWIEWFERPFQRIGRWWLPPVITAIVIVVLANLPANHHGHETLVAGLIGAATYVVIHGLTMLIERTTKHTSKLAHYTGWAAATMFLYLELLDASFSLDGVLGAFAITSDVVLIMAGLGAGAVWVRSLTVHMVRNGTLDAYRFLEHGAHYAIVALALSMLISPMYEMPEAITGTVGVGLIVASVVSSVRANRNTPVKA